VAGLCILYLKIPAFAWLSFTDHPNIIHLFEICSTKRKIWIITELCTGGDLGERARSTPTGMTEYEVADVMEQILRALAYLHSRGVCHRDLKFEVSW